MSSTPIEIVKRELIRFVPLVVAVLLLAWDDSTRLILFYLGIVFLFGYVSHILRKLYFPYIDLKVFADKAKEEPLPAAIVFAAVTYLLAVLAQTSIVLFK